MTPTALASSSGHTVFTIVGFAPNAAPAGAVCQRRAGGCGPRIEQVSFDADGVRSTGQFTVQVTDSRQLAQIDRRLQLVRGVIQVTQRVAIR